MMRAHPTRADPPPLAGPLQAAARGIHPVEAGVDLLISHGVFLRRGDFTTHYVQLGTDLTDGTQLAGVEWSAAVIALDTGQLPCSRSEGQIVRLAASLAEGIPVNLRDAVTSLDDANIDRVTRAVQHAGGRGPQP